MSKLTYNGIEIALTKTLGISHVPARADDGSYLFTRVTIDVEGIVSGPPAQDQTPPNVANPSGTLGAPVSDLMRAIRGALLQERRPLVYDVGDSRTPMIVAPPLDDAGNFAPVDCANGPIPVDLRIRRVDGISAFHVTFSVTCALLECPGYAGSGPIALIANRWEQQHSIDGTTWLTTISTAGEATFRTDILQKQGLVPDHYREVLIPPTPRGFRLASLRIRTNQANDRLQYDVVHEERTFDLGNTGPGGTNSNITDVQAEYMAASTGQAGAPVTLVSQQSVNVTVLGSKAAQTWTLVKAALTVAESVLPLFDPNRGYLAQIGIRAALTGRQVSLQATMMVTNQGAGQVPGIDLTSLRQGVPFAPKGGINPPLPSRSGTAGTYSNEAMASAWKAACQAPKKPSEGQVASASYDPNYSDATGPIVQVTVTNDLPERVQGYSVAQTQFPYTRYRVDKLLQTFTGVLGMPNSGAAAGGGGYLGGGSYGSTPPDTEFITVARPRQVEVYEWEAERVGSVPALPSPTALDANLVLIDQGHVQLGEPNLLADGVSVAYSVRGRYVYGLRKNRKSTDPIQFPAPPWQQHTYGELALTFADFGPGIIGNPGVRSSTG